MSLSAMKVRLRNFLSRVFAKPIAMARLLRHYWKRVAATTIVVAHILGAWTSVEVIMESRTTQGAIAWAISLNTFPYVAVPAYWIFGHSEFEGYVLAREATLSGAKPVAAQLTESLNKQDLRVPLDNPLTIQLQSLSKLPFTRANDARLLIDGRETYDAIFEAIDEATSYVLVQFYIVQDDETGRALQQRLMAKARAGVLVYFLLDAIGSLNLPESFTSEMREAGVKTAVFRTTLSSSAMTQVNFRNHRKNVIVDGKIAFTGGLNIGEEYLGRHEKLTPWRDTFVRVTGPVVQFFQVPFAEDWLWAEGDLLTDILWTPAPAASGKNMEALCLSTGPADPLDTCAMFFLAVINSAKKRIWIATPYFVPDEQIVSALQLAALRGVDVRILIPAMSDSELVRFSSFSYLPEVEQVGIKMFRFQKGFLHEKVVLVDEDFASVGSANFDNRSFRLNFEITLAVRDRAFAASVEDMFERDFANSTPATAADLTERNFFFRLAVRVARLLSPIQ
jgi:cardiolipin synthase A/B